MSWREIKVDRYYCPKCLDVTGCLSEPDEWLTGMRKGECLQCFLNVKLHSWYEYLGEIDQNELDAFIKDPARKSDPRFDPEAYDTRDSLCAIAI